MKVPYANKWRKETELLRTIGRDCDLVEEVKWAKRCFTYRKKNVAIVIPLKDSCALSFFKGALLQDPQRILHKVGEHSQSARWVKFTLPEEITAMRPVLKKYLYEAVKVEESGKKVALKKPADYPVPEELQAALDGSPELRQAYEALTPGRRKSYIFYVSSAKQPKTRADRARKCIPMILTGRGFLELQRDRWDANR